MGAGDADWNEIAIAMDPRTTETDIPEHMKKLTTQLDQEGKSMIKWDSKIGAPRLNGPRNHLWLPDDP